MTNDILTQFPHCDQTILHAPGECVYCDRHPEVQELRDRWYGNVARPANSDPATDDWFKTVSGWVDELEDADGNLPPNLYVLDVDYAGPRKPWWKRFFS